MFNGICWMNAITYLMIDQISNMISTRDIFTDSEQTLIVKIPKSLMNFLNWNYLFKISIKHFNKVLIIRNHSHINKINKCTIYWHSIRRINWKKIFRKKSKWEKNWRFYLSKQFIPRHPLKPLLEVHFMESRLKKTTHSNSHFETNTFFSDWN